MIIIEEKIPIYLSQDEAMLFVAFQKNYQVVAYILGTMEALRLNEIRNASLTMDFDPQGSITHSSITQHYKKHPPN